MAIDTEIVKSEKILHFEIGNIQAVALYDEALKAVRVYNSNGYTFTEKDGKIFDQTGLEWTAAGMSIDSDLKLTTLIYFDVMWFAWYAYYPETGVIR